MAGRPFLQIPGQTTAVQGRRREVLCAGKRHHSSSLIAVLMQEGHPADALRRVGLGLGGVPQRKGGCDAAMRVLEQAAASG